jgi:hypothetical protein
VSASGMVTALAPGTARITAGSEGRSGTSTVAVVDQSLPSSGSALLDTTLERLSRE